jgi:hypothetical protein
VREETVDVGNGPEPGLSFAISIYGRRPSPDYPATYDVLIDANRDGQADHVLFNADIAPADAPQPDGRNAVFAGPITGPFAGQLFTDADFDSGNVVLAVPLSAVGLRNGQAFDFTVEAGDAYYTGNTTDAIDHMTYTVGQPKYVVDEGPTFGVPGSTFSATAHISATGTTARSTQTGILLQYRVNAGAESTLVGVQGP